MDKVSCLVVSRLPRLPLLAYPEYAHDVAMWLATFLFVDHVLECVGSGEFTLDGSARAEAIGHVVAGGLAVSLRFTTSRTSAGSARWGSRVYIDILSGSIYSGSNIMSRFNDWYYWPRSLPDHLMYAGRVHAGIVMDLLSDCCGSIVSVCLFVVVK